MGGRLLSFPSRYLSSEEGRLASAQILETPIADRTGRANSLRLDDPETLLATCARLRESLETAPAVVREEVEFFYRFLEKPKRPIGLFDERDYFLGELALIAGTACRVLSRRDEARRWFDRSESYFRHTVNAVSEWSRLTYQRLSLRVEERHFEDVLELLPSLAESFVKLEMEEDALKCSFLEGIILMETDRLPEAISLYREIYRRASALGAQRLAATASYNMVQIYGMLGDAEAALSEAAVAVPLLRQLDNRVGLAKIQWGLGGLLRTQGKLEAAIENYRAAQGEFRDIGMRADLAALHLVIADLLIERGEDAHAMSEVLAALPIIEEEKMVPEGMAALALLRESVRAQRLNRQALRDLHGYFEELA